MPAPSPNYWESDRTRLRAIEPDDVELLHGWDRHAATVREFSRLGPPRCLVGMQQWLEKKATEEQNRDEFTVLSEEFLAQHGEPASGRTE